MPSQSGVAVVAPNKPLVFGVCVFVAAFAAALVQEQSVMYNMIRLPLDLVKNTASFGVTITRTIVLTTTATITLWCSLQGFKRVSIKMGWKEEDDTITVMNRKRTSVGLAAGQTSCLEYSALKGAELDSTQWINEILANVWPMITKYLETNLKESIEKSIQAAVPMGGSSTIYFKDISAGTIPMQFRNMHTRVLQKQHVHGGVQAMLQLNLDVDYAGDLKIVLSAFGAKVGISNFLLKGPMIIEFPQVLPEPPFLSGMSFYFPIKPQISMDWEGLAALAKDPTFGPKVQGAIESQVSSRMVLPNRIGKIMAARDQLEKFRILKPRPEGVLRVQVKSAKNLKAADVSLMSMRKAVSSDPFVRVELGDLCFQTKTIKTNLNPAWENEAHNFFVQYPGVQKVFFNVFDEDKFSSADLLGKCHASVMDLVARDSSAPLTLSDDDGHGENTCASLGSQLFVEATFKPLLVDATSCRRIEPGSVEPTCMLFVGVSTALGLPAAEPGCSHWCDVVVKDIGCKEYNWSSIHAMVTQQDQKAELHKKKKLAAKIKTLEGAHVDKKVINDVLELNENSNLNDIGDISAIWDDGLFHLLHDPTAATVEFEIKTDAMPDGKVKKGNVRCIGRKIVVQVSEIVNASENTQVDRALSFGVEDDTQVLNVMLQLRVLGKPSKDIVGAPL